MQRLAKGVYLGQAVQTYRCGPILVSENEYAHGPKLPWHYHENPYFMYVLSGQFVECTKDGLNKCGPGSLVFHNSQNPHRDEHADYSRILHVEVGREFLTEYEVPRNPEGSINLEDPAMVLAFDQIYREVKVRDQATHLAVEGLLLHLFARMTRSTARDERKVPPWVGLLAEILGDNPAAKLTLRSLSERLQIHPVYLSRQFPRYFRSTLGEYLRKARIRKAVQLMRQCRDKSLAEIALECGFSDQSHFGRTFRRILGVTPSIYRSTKLPG